MVKSPTAIVSVSPIATALLAVTACQSVFCVPAVDAENIAVCVTVPAAVAAELVSAVLLDFRLGVAFVALAQPVAPTAVRAMPAHSLVPFVEYATWSVLPEVGCA